VSIADERYTHGHAFDFFKRLRATWSSCTCWATAGRARGYLYVQDCLGTMLQVVACAQDMVNIYHLGTDEYCQVIDSIGGPPRIWAVRRARV